MTSQSLKDIAPDIATERIRKGRPVELFDDRNPVDKAGGILNRLPSPIHHYAPNGRSAGKTVRLSELKVSEPSPPLTRSLRMLPPPTSSPASMLKISILAFMLISSCLSLPASSCDQMTSLRAEVKLPFGSAEPNAKAAKVEKSLTRLPGAMPVTLSTTRPPQMVIVTSDMVQTVGVVRL